MADDNKKQEETTMEEDLVKLRDLTEKVVEYLSKKEDPTDEE